MPSFRRKFLQDSLAIAAVGTVTPTQFGRAVTSEAAPSETVRVGIMGAGGRALSLIDSFSRNKSVQVVAIADIDPSRFPAAVEITEKNQGTKPRTERDFRRLIDDKSIDALVVGTPDHWKGCVWWLPCANTIASYKWDRNIAPMRACNLRLSSFKPALSVAA